jgi:putative YhdH/YhfP family quinone oxidoreductase
MKQHHFTALIVEETTPANFTRRIATRTVAELPPGELLVKVHYSSLNFKDALSATGRPGVTRHYPHTPGIDAAGEVLACSDGMFTPGDQVVVTGHDLGMETSGGFGQCIRVPSHWAMRLPRGLTLRESMILGTAGFTAALSTLKLQRNGVIPGNGDILVTGATGGVGSLAVAILARGDYRVIAATGKASEQAYLQALGATAVIGRDEVLAGSERPLSKERWAGVVDVVGGEMLAAAIKATRYGGTVTCCGLVGSAELPINVYPFILRSVSLLGIDSAQCPRELRLAVWEKLAGPWKPANLESLTTECTLHTLEEQLHTMLRGATRGRILVNLLES